MRYAIYVAPRIEAAEAWLGRGPAPGGWTRAEVDAITENVRRYGFHGTIKAPFRLAPGVTATDLDARLDAFAAHQEPVVVPALRLACLNGFFALIPARPEPALQAFAADVVREFDDLRAPLSDADLARRRPERLDDRERELLSTYGYPYVLERFLFHLTLTDPIPPAAQGRVESTLRTLFAPALGRDLVLDALALFADPEAGQPFSLVSTYPLKGAQ